MSVQIPGISPENINVRTIKYGGLHKDELLKELSNASVLLNDYAKTLFSSDQFVVSTDRRNVSIVEIAIRDLGFTNGASLQEIAERAREFGLMACPMDLAPYFRLQYLDQKEEYESKKNKAPQGSITVISKLLKRDDDFPKGFYLRRIDGNLWLRGYICSLDWVWNPGDRIALMMKEEID